MSEERSIEERLADLEEWAIDTGIHASAIKFVVEILLAQTLRNMSPADAQKAVMDITSPFRQTSPGANDLTEEDMRNAHERLFIHVENLVERAARRASELRASAGQAPPSR